jgi:hypothetical protein
MNSQTGGVSGSFGANTHRMSLSAGGQCRRERKGLQRTDWIDRGRASDRRGGAVRPAGRGPDPQGLDEAQGISHPRPAGSHQGEEQARQPLAPWRLIAPSIFGAIENIGLDSLTAARGVRTQANRGLQIPASQSACPANHPRPNDVCLCNSLEDGIGSGNVALKAGMGSVAGA